MQGYLALILHAHLPFVRHPEYPEFLEEDWLFEAIAETYLPLLETYEGLWRDGIDFRVSMTLSPPLVSMLRDPLLQERCAERLRRLIDLAEDEVERHKDHGHLHYLAGWYRDLLNRRLHQFEVLYERDLAAAFKKFQDRGRLEILTCCATHGFLPLLSAYEPAVRAQVRVAVDFHTEVFGRRPRGIWLAECAYFPGLDRILREEGLEYFVGETHAVRHATPRPRYDVHAPIVTPSGVAVFARDIESSQQVWSSVVGYPGDPDYREFYRDIGFDSPLDEVRAWVQPNGLRKMTGIKYRRVTGKTENKELYDPHRAEEKAAMHAADFTLNRAAQISHLHSLYGGHQPLIVAPYDAELFGHWWYEGPRFIDYLLRQVSCDRDSYNLTTPGEYLRANPTQQVAQPPMSSWGEGGYSKVWLNERNDWIYPHLDAMAERMTSLADRFEEPTALELRALQQAARELLLAQSSDWAFIITQDTNVNYAVKRTREHIVRFNRLYEALTGFGVDEEMLEAIETRDNIFPNIDYTVYRS
jgi:1,4-alpha-glucan branching enzyme